MLRRRAWSTTLLAGSSCPSEPASKKALAVWGRGGAASAVPLVFLSIFIRGRGYWIGARIPAPREIERRRRDGGRDHGSHLRSPTRIRGTGKRKRHLSLRGGRARLRGFLGRAGQGTALV